jgi:hypothetical protein
MANVAKRSSCSVSHVGELVRLKFGNQLIDMHYSDALQFSQWMRLNAKEAKRESGDRSRVVQMAGILSDAEENYRKGI